MVFGPRAKYSFSQDALCVEKGGLYRRGKESDLLTRAVGSL